MKFPVQAAQAAALMLLSAQQCQATVGHRHVHHFHKRHTHGHPQTSPKEEMPVEKRGVQCQLPADAGLEYVPGPMNNGWALSPDIACRSGDWCPYACPPGQVMAQWQPGSRYVYPESMNGGLQCGDDGVARKAFHDQPYCKPGAGSVNAINKIGKTITFCQTVLPGREDMLIPTVVDSSATLAVPDPSYWDGTAAHYYINPPGYGKEACIWGTNRDPIGNWAPFVCGMNQVRNGETFVTLSWNPIFQFEGAGLEKNLPRHGARIECPDGGCNGLPCSLEPGRGLGAVNSNTQSVGAGGASFCVVTVPAGKKANIVLYPLDGPEVDGPAPPASSASPDSSSYADSSTAGGSSSALKSAPTVKPGIFHENTTTSDDLVSKPTGPPSAPSSPGSATTSTQPNEGVGRQQGSAAIAGLIVALVATACFY